MIQGTHNLANLYDNGTGVKKSYVISKQLYEKSAAKFNVSQHELAKFYEYGKGVPVNLVKAEKWYQRASIPSRTRIGGERQFAQLSKDKLKLPKFQKVASKEMTKKTRGDIYSEIVRVTHEYYLGDIVIGKCVGSELISKRDQKDYRKRLNELVEGMFDMPKYKVSPKDHDKVKDMIFDEAQKQFRTNSKYMSYFMMESAMNFGRPISNYEHKAHLRELCQNVKSLMDGLVNGLLMNVGRNKKKKRNF
jgi:hypothetical protein